MPSKLCPHVLAPTPAARQLVAAGSRLVKLAGTFGPAEEMLGLRPDLILIGRVVDDYDPNPGARGGEAPEQAARAFVDRQREQYRLNPLLQIWEGPNEPVFGSASDPANMQAVAWYAAFEAERLRLLADMGLRGVVGNFATGNPDLPMWLAFLPALDAAEQFDGFLGLHEYSSPWMWWLTGDFQAGNCQPDPTFSGEGDTGWLTLRYRKVYRDYLIPNGVGDVRLIITECGLDQIGPVCPGYTSGPWRAHPDFWRGHDGARDPIDYWRGPERDPERYYAEQLMWYDRELQRDSYVLGATIFTVGTLSDQWRPFDIAGTRVADFIADYIRTVGAEPLPAPPPAAPTAPPAEERIPPIAEPAAPALPKELLLNPGFELVGGASGVQDWRPWWREQAKPADGSFDYAYQPRWNAERLSTGAAPALILSGDASLRVINNWDPWHAGVRQVAQAAPGARVRLSAHGRLWASNEDWPAPSDPTAAGSLRIGLDLEGGEDPFAAAVLWSEPIRPHDEWGVASVQGVVGASGRVGVFLSADYRGHSRKFLASFWDEASLAVAVPPTAPVVEPPAVEPETIIIPPGPDTAAPPPRPNLLINASFEDGLAYFADETRELAVPAGWVLSYRDADTAREPRQTANWGRPVTALINSANVATADRPRVFAGGLYCWKISGTGSPVWVRLAQSLTGLQPGRGYRFTLNLLPDLIIRTHPQVAYAGDPLSGEARLRADFAARSFDSGWLTGRDAPFGRYTALALDFDAPGQRVELSVEVRGRWALPLGAWYVDELSLVEA